MQFTSMQGATSYNFNPRSRIGFDGIPSFHRGQSWDFNPRSRIGFDMQTFRNAANPANISIHEAV